MIISFAWTTPALVVGEKTVTRRYWNDEYGARFRAGLIVDAWDRQPRYKGRKIGRIRLIADARKESTANLPGSDWKGEGFAVLTELGAKVDGATPRALWRLWEMYPRDVWVVRFELVDLTADGRALRDETRKKLEARATAGRLL